ncbi:MAG: hypothetical protein K8R74_12935 [Bacteroidales bacterium]|nr:hypothetical protein [Bacteroidales bacterium]
MKTLLKVLGIIIILLIALIFLLPLFFKGQISDLVKSEVNKSINATVEFKDVSLSLFKSLPNFNLEINDLIISGTGEFEQDTLANIESIDITIDLFSVFKGSNYEAKRIRINKPNIFLKILENGETNYNITSTSTTETEESHTDEEDASFNLILKKFEIREGRIEFNDASSGVHLILAGFNHTLSGNLSLENTMLNTTSLIDQFTVNYNGINYLSSVQLAFKAEIEADLKNQIFILRQNELRINDLHLNFDGNVSFINEDINLVLIIQTPDTEFKNILSLVPAVYAKDFETVQTSGTLKLEGFVKGIYNEFNIPSFDLDLQVSDAMFKYPELPKAVTNIVVDAKITNSGGSMDNTIIDISKLTLKLGNNPVDMKIKVQTPVSDPEIDTKIRGRLDLATVSDFYPLSEDQQLKGTFIAADVTLQGKLSAIENRQFEKVTAYGSIQIKDFEYTSSLISDPFTISNAQLVFTPNYIDLVTLKSNIGESDINAQGQLENYLAYAFTNGIIKGNLITSSRHFDISAFLPKETGVEQTGTKQIPDSLSREIIVIPSNINFEIASSFDRLIYDNIVMGNVSGRLAIRDQKLEIKDLNMNVLDGEMIINGFYNTFIPDQPEISFDIDMSDINIQRTYNTLRLMNTYAPIARKTTGLFSTHLTLNTKLDNKMDPVYESMTGSGTLQTSEIKIEGVNTLEQIAEVLNLKELRELELNNLSINYEFVDGKILVKPFTLRYADFVANIGGWTSFNQSIDYVMDLNIPREKFGTAVNNVISDLISQAESRGTRFNVGDTVSIDILIFGSLAKPRIETNLKETGISLLEDVNEQIKEEIKVKKRAITKETRERAQRILNDADKQTKRLIAVAKRQAKEFRKKADQSANKIREEADRQAAAIEQEGKKKGFLAAAAAKETAKALRKEANLQAEMIVQEAERKARQVINKAETEGDYIRANAQREVDKMLGRN